MTNIFKNKDLLKEILRFIIVGVICTVLDFVTNLIFLSFLPESIGFWRMVIAITAGFIVGVIANYLFSTYFVFKNVEDDKKAKTVKYIVIFVILSAIGLGLNYGIFYFFYWIFLSTCGIDINISFSFDGALWSSLAFWLYVIVFCIKTLIVLVYNYLTRKFLIYTAPKEVPSDESK